MSKRTSFLLSICTVGFVCAVSSFTWASDAELRRAQRFYGEKAYDKAAEILEDLSRREEDVGAASAWLGHSYYELERFADARQAYARAIGRGQLNADVLVRLIQIERRENRPAAVLNLLRLVQLVDPGKEDVLLNLAQSAADAGLAGEAETAFRQLTELYPLNSEVELRLGNLHACGGQHAKALVAFKRAYHLGSSTADVATMIADLSHQLDSIEQAALWYERAARLGADADGRLRLRWAQLLFLGGDSTQASKVAREVTQLEGEAPRLSQHRGEAHLLLGEISGKNGDARAAVEHLQKALTLGIRSAALHSYVGRHYFRQKEFARAVEHLRAFVELEPSSGEGLSMLVRSHLALQQPDPARADLRTYLEFHGFDDEARALISLLTRN